MTDRTEGIRERWSRATPGPWFVGVHAETMVFAGGDTISDRSVASCGGYSSNGPDGHAQWQFNYDNAEAIAAAPEDVAYLLAEIEKLRGENYSDLLDQMDEAWGPALTLGRSEINAFIESRIVHTPTVCLRKELRALASRVTDKMLEDSCYGFHANRHTIGRIFTDLRTLAGGGE